VSPPTEGSTFRPETLAADYVCSSMQSLGRGIPQVELDRIAALHSYHIRKDTPTLSNATLECICTVLYADRFARLSGG